MLGKIPKNRTLRILLGWRTFSLVWFCPVCKKEAHTLTAQYKYKTGRVLARLHGLEIKDEIKGLMMREFADIHPDVTPDPKDVRETEAVV
jgi:hypothetical protein